MWTAQPLIQGAWSEILSHKDAIPGTQRVKVYLDPVSGEEEEAQSRLQKMIVGFLSGVERIAAKEHRPVEEVGEEMVRQAGFPEIEFRDILGERTACVKGRLEIWQLAMVARHYEEDKIAKTAEHLVLRPEAVRCALDYYAAYPEEIDAALAENDGMTYEEMRRRHPKQNIQLREITDEAIARIEEKYPSLKDLDL